MRIVSQNISSGMLEVEGRIIAKTGPGLALFVGFTHGDDLSILTQMADKAIHMRVLPDELGKTNRSILDTAGEFLVIPNFTLYGSLTGGRRPSFTQAMNQQEANDLFLKFVALLQERYPRVASGVFGADMKIALVNEGPFTIELDSGELFGSVR
jgi:D-tyrosyl-tRNA(Tyr) deacylase